ncbi:MAG: hypothetical protein K2J77_01925 [Oscillospiraceae bacterium]|nr:hypothetical protein [Oscillospiraceae bacterium]
MGLFGNFGKKKKLALPSYRETNHKYNCVAVEVEETEESLSHIDEDFATLVKADIDNIIAEKFIPWLKCEEFADRDDKLVFEGLRVCSVTYYYYSPSGEGGFFGRFEFDFVSSSDYTEDMLECVAMEVYIQNGEVVRVSGFEV